MKYLHTMVRVTDLDASLKFYCDALGLRELSRKDYPQGRYTLVFLAAPGDESAQVELTHNWDPEVYGGGRAYQLPVLGIDFQGSAGASARRPCARRAAAAGWSRRGR